MMKPVTDQNDMIFYGIYDFCEIFVHTSCFTYLATIEFFFKYEKIVNTNNLICMKCNGVTCTLFLK